MGELELARRDLGASPIGVQLVRGRVGLGAASTPKNAPGVLVKLSWKPPLFSTCAPVTVI